MSTKLKTQEVRDLAREAVEAHPHSDQSKIARQIFRTLDDAEIQRAALAWVSFNVWRAQRDRQLHVERESERRAERVRLDKINQQSKERYQKTKRQTELTEAMADQFKTWSTEPSSFPRQYLFSKPENLGEEVVAFEDWMRSSGISRAQVVESASDIHGLSPEEKISALDYWGEALAAMEVGIQLRIEEAAKQVRLELGGDLLKSDFALGDGTRVSWGKATREQHQMRAQMMSTKSVSIAEDAARHLAAVRIMDESKADSLEEVSKL
jgi:hypothetical protein